MPRSKNPETSKSTSTAATKAAKAPKATKATNGAPPAKGDGDGDLLQRQHEAMQQLAAARPFNELKAGEHGRDPALQPQAGTPVEPADESATASSVRETVVSIKLGSQAQPGHNPGNESLDRVRVDSGGQALTTNQGVRVADNQNSLKAGLRGPTLLEDFILREKITHFDHERIPERVVHARGSAAHGYFECYDPLDQLTMAAPFAAAGKRTPVFVRFSTVAGERGSFDTARDVRGFAVKFYTDDGNWDLVGNNIPVFFIQDAMKFPDLVHALKPEPHHAMPQAASAHDTFWDFVSLMPESAHMLMWVMSDRAIPRSYRMMQGFGVHTFRLVNAAGESKLCKFHWSPRAGTHSLVWDEAVKISGADPDFHRRDLWEAIEAGSFPEWELGLQIFDEEQAENFRFDVLDPTKIVPEELVPLLPVGRLVLNRNPDNFFAETEQVAFCTAHIVPGIDFTNDPLLQGRIHSYVDTQLTRLGGPNFHEIPINASIAQVHNNQRDGLHRQAIHRGSVSYEPNSLAGGCPFQAGRAGGGFVSIPTPFPATGEGDKLRGKPERFADHFSQATLFWRSQSEPEQRHIAGAFRFELSKVQVPAVRERVVSLLANVDAGLAAAVAEGLGFAVPAPQPRALEPAVESELDSSPALSLLARPGDGGVQTRRVALLVVDGADLASLRAAQTALREAGATPRFVGPRIGPLGADESMAIEMSFEQAPSVLWDAVVLANDAAAARPLSMYGQALDFVKDQYRHCKPILALGGPGGLLAAVNLPLMLPEGEADPGLFVCAPPSETDPALRTDADTVTAFIAGLARHRHFERETDPPRV
ncbi:catalase [Roseateles violae]|uniref:catalase n=1 Tax=Roseateles violae TaxID=3058042 RepID=A0ABT8DVZ5_9BURK|nr:catalase [Pelomonas sp. PFR6]MDN3922328.1 catalase [Pelomonas sp. PFR6]